ncbi:DUF4139 domain-containing protein [Gymnodinialimonas sp. 2305UL16-5]|uniref:DUF4139 domain-containing protein n=1 Tax=Gymnodinialimonas mytili TaxID=3126503 RepID=UPI0030AE5E49
MKRIFLTTALSATFPLIAQADDLLIRAELTEAVVFGQGADVIRSGAVTIPAGQHRLLIAMPDLDAAQLPQITASDGVTLGLPQRVFNHPVAEGALDDAEQATARAALEAAEDDAQAAQDALTEANTRIRSIETQQGYIAAILRGGDSGVAMPEDPALVPQFLATLGAESARLADELLEAEVARRDLSEAVTDAQRAVADTTRALQDLSPIGLQVGVFAIDVTAVAETEAQIELSYFTHNAAWQPSYELALNTQTDILEIDRYVTLQTFGAARWKDVAVTFSTSDPFRDRAPTELSSIPARIEPPRPQAQDGYASLGGLRQADALVPPSQPLGAPMAEPTAIEESAVVASFDGLSVTYDYPRPVTIGADGQALLNFDTLELSVETENRAVPRWDDTAFLVAMGDNTTGEPILPGQARFYRDGALLGEGFVPLIAAGAETEMAFGALDHLQLTWIDRSLAEGDRGIFTTSTTQNRQISFGVENTGTEPETVRVLYATPFAEQEDLDLDLSLSPRPTEENVDDARGVHAWDLDVSPREDVMIDMDVSFEFPEGQILTWRP